MRRLTRPLVGVVVTVFAGIVLVVSLVAVAVHNARNSVESTSPQTPEIAPASEDVFDVAARQLQAMPPVVSARTAPAPPNVEPPPVTPASEPANTQLSLLPPDELAMRVGKGWLDNGCFACEIKTDSTQSHWIATEMTVRVTVFRSNRTGVESRLCPLHFVGLVRGEAYTMSYSAQPALYLQPGDRWEWKIVEARGFPVMH